MEHILENNYLYKLFLWRWPHNFHILSHPLHLLSFIFPVSGALHIFRRTQSLLTNSTPCQPGNKRRLITAPLEESICNSHFAQGKLSYKDKKKSSGHFRKTFYSFPIIVYYMEQRLATTFQVRFLIGQCNIIHSLTHGFCCKRH